MIARRAGTRADANLLCIEKAVKRYDNFCFSVINELKSGLENENGFDLGLSVQVCPSPTGKLR